MLLVALAITVGTSAAAARAPRHDAYDVLLAHSDTLFVHGGRPAAEHWLDSLVASAREHGDASLDAAASVRRASALLFSGRSDAARSDIAHALPIARGRHDSLTLARALLVSARIDLFAERLDACAPTYRELLPLARALHRPELEGNARLGLAYLELKHGHFAAAATGYRAALRLVVRAHDAQAEMTARVGLARAYAALDRRDEADAAYAQVIARSHEIRDPRDESDAWNNLGADALEAGDPVAAADDFARSVAIRRATQGLDVSATVCNLARMLMALGRYDEAVAQIEQERGRTQPPLRASERALMDGLLGELRATQGLPAEGERLMRSAYATSDSIDAEDAASVALNWAAFLAERSRSAEALAVAEHALARSGARPMLRLSLEMRAADAERQSAKPELAIVRMRRCALDPALAAAWAPSTRHRGEQILAQAWLDRGMPDSALVHVQAAASAWEHQRASVSDPEWLEVVGHDAGTLALLTARVLCDPRRGGTESSRAAEAFDALQRFRARALESRLAAKEPVSPARWQPAGVRALQRRVLRDGELLLDVYEARSDTTLMIAVDRTTVRACWLSSNARLYELSARLRDLSGSPDGDDPGLRATTLALAGKEWFGGVADLLARAHTLLICASASLAIAPLPALVVGSVGSADLLSHHELAYLPSAGWLAAERAKPALAPAAPLLVALGHDRDEQGRRLSGVASELAWLAGRYPRARVLPHLHSRAEAIAALAHADAVHLAGHARSAQQDPWSSAILLGDGAGADAWLEARAVATLHLPARLCVLASCRTLARTGFGTESCHGLATGFLAAGVPSVLCTLWAVDDAVTAELVRGFYAGLERGLTAAAALRAAQGEIAAHAATAHPYYWAGFALMGEPDLKLALRSPARR